MKKKMLILLVVVLLVVGYTHDQFLWCTKLFSSDPQTHKIEKGEYLSAIAKKYYGNPDYWKELALINRSPNSNLVFPGEEIIVPRLSVIKEIRRTRWMSKVNSLISSENNILARLDKSEVEETYHAQTMQDTVEAQAPAAALTAQEPNLEPVAEEEIETESASSLYLFGGIGIVFIVALITFLVYRKKKQSETFTFDDIDNSNGASADEDSEPDYQEYLRKKSKMKKEKVLAK